MQANNKSVIETLVAIDRQRIPAQRLRGLKPSVIRFCFDHALVKDYVGHGVMLSPYGVANLQANVPGWSSLVRAEATPEWLK